MEPIIIATPAAPHPKAEILEIDAEAARIRFRWLNLAEQTVDSGNSLAPYTPGPSEPTEAELAAALTAATA